MAVLPALCKIGGSTGFYTASVVNLFLGTASGATQGSVYMMAAAFPPQYMAAVMFGNGLAGIGVILLRGLAIGIWPADGADGNAFKATLSLYIFAAVFLAVCALAQVYINKSLFAQYYLAKMSVERQR